MGRRRGLVASVLVLVVIVVLAGSTLPAVIQERRHVAAFDQHAAALERTPSFREMLEAFQGMRAAIAPLDVHPSSRSALLRWANPRADRSELRERYAKEMEARFAGPCTRALAERLRGAADMSILDTYLLTRMYLAAANPTLAEEQWLAGRHAQLWIDLDGGDPLADGLLASQEIAYYFDLVEWGAIRSLEPDPEAIEHARKKLQSAEPSYLWWGLLVDDLADRRAVEYLPRSADNQLYPPVTWSSILARSPALEPYLEARSVDVLDASVPGVFRFELLQAARKSIEHAHWEDLGFVFGREHEANQPGFVDAMDAHEREATKAWRAFAANVALRAPHDAEEARQLYGMLGSDRSPLFEVLGVFTTTPASRRGGGINPEQDLRKLNFGPHWSGQHVERFTGIYQRALAAVRDPDADLIASAPELAQLRDEMNQLLDAFGQPLREMLDPIILLPLQIDGG